ncbi:MAG: exodeoxyribonuclease VII large subunit [Acidimicrobiia bacterium]
MSQTTFELGDVAEERTFSVGELTTGVSDAVRRAFPEQVWVKGEVQNLKRYPNGHTYFSLVEKAAGPGDRVKARLDCVLFRDDRPAVNRALEEVPGAELGNDVEVRIRGRVGVYAVQGRLQFVMAAIDPVFTVGGIAANRERVLRVLAADGLLDANGRLPLPLVPLRVGLITSIESAAYHDFVHELDTSGFAFQVGAVDVRVQGAAASRRIVWALHELSARNFDVVVIVRGGGSRADLAPFDTEQVAREIAAMSVPVLTGVGHEVDRSVADEVAHTACKTPTACAQILLNQVRSFVQSLDRAAQRVGARARSRAALAARELDDAARRVQRGAPAALARERAHVDQRSGRVEELGRRRTRDAQVALAARERAVVTAATHHLRRATTRLDGSVATLRALEPRRVLERGYTITRIASGRVVRRASDATVGDELVTELAAGRVASRVERVEEETP